MENNLKKWCKLKEKLHFGNRIKFHVKQREIWYVNIGVNIGHESYGKGNDFKRPALVIKKVGSQFLVIPMTSKGKENNFKYKISNTYFGYNSFLVLSQGKFMDQKRFIKKINVINKQDFEKIKKRLITDWF